MRVPLAAGATGATADRRGVGFLAAFAAGWFLDLGGVASLVAGAVCGVAVGIASYFYSG